MKHKQKTTKITEVSLVTRRTTKKVTCCSSSHISAGR